MSRGPFQPLRCCDSQFPEAEADSGLYRITAWFLLEKAFKDHCAPPLFHSTNPADEELWVKQPPPSHPSVLPSTYNICPSPDLEVQLPPDAGKDELPKNQAMLLWLLLNVLQGDFQGALLT